MVATIWNIYTNDLFRISVKLIYMYVYVYTFEPVFEPSS